MSQVYTKEQLEELNKLSALDRRIKEVRESNSFLRGSRVKLPRKITEENISLCEKEVREAYLDSFK